MLSTCLFAFCQSYSSVPDIHPWLYAHIYALKYKTAFGFQRWMVHDAALALSSVTPVLGPIVFADLVNCLPLKAVTSGLTSARGDVTTVTGSALTACP